jgi:hypothetical protein
VGAGVAGVAAVAVAAVAAAWLRATAVSAAVVVAGWNGRSGEARRARERPLRCSRSGCAAPEGARARLRARLGSGRVGALLGPRPGAVRVRVVAARSVHAPVRRRDINLLRCVCNGRNGRNGRSYGALSMVRGYLRYVSRWTAVSVCGV